MKLDKVPDGKDYVHQGIYTEVERLRNARVITVMIDSSYGKASKRINHFLRAYMGAGLLTHVGENPDEGILLMEGDQAAVVYDWTSIPGREGVASRKAMVLAAQQLSMTSPFAPRIIFFQNAQVKQAGRTGTKFVTQPVTSMFVSDMALLLTGVDDEERYVLVRAQYNRVGGHFRVVDGEFVYNQR